MIENFGQSLRNIRLSRGMTLEEMAKLLETTKQALSRYERGERTPKITIAADFADKLGVDLKILVGEDSESMTLEPPDTDKTPQTYEARILARGIDRLPQEQREQALAMFKLMFTPQFADLFSKGEDE